MQERQGRQLQDQGFRLCEEDATTSGCRAGGHGDTGRLAVKASLQER